MTSATIASAAVVEQRNLRDSPSARGARNVPNYLVRVVATTPERQLVGIGEGNPRGSATGDDPEKSLAWLTETVRSLVGTRLPLLDRGEALSAVSSLLATLQTPPPPLEQTDAGPPGSTLHGTLIGVETSLLDIIARGRDEPLHRLLGNRRADIAVTGPIIALDQPLATCEKQYRRLPQDDQTIRFSLASGTRDAVSRLQQLRASNSDSRPDEVWWIEAAGGFTFDSARDFVDVLIKEMRRGRLPNQLILEQPLPPSHRRELAQLQRHCDKRSRWRKVDLRIMADESLATVGDLKELLSNGGCRAINIKAPRVGGLRRSQEIAELVADQQPDTVVALSSMAASTDVAFWAMYHLALSLPRLDYFTRPPITAAAVNTVSPQPTFQGSSRRIAPPDGPGLGCDLQLAALIDNAESYIHVPEPAAAPFEGRPLRTYPGERATQRLPKSTMRSYLVERAALVGGLSTARYSPTSFVARSADGTPLMFGASARSPVSSAASFIISDQHKGSAHALLGRAGVPLPEGRVFAADDLAGAKEYARSIGFPVVSKPVAGTGGAGVSTNLADEADLEAGFAAIRATRFAADDVLVQRHVPGDVYRVMVCDGEVTAALLRVPPSVVGDGGRCIAELIIEKNTYRLENPRLRKGLISRDRTEHYLRRAGASLSDVPPAGERVPLAGNAYLNLGGDSVDVLDELHPSIIAASIAAVQAIPGLRFCGVDILLEDHRLPLEQQSAGICELNACPELITPQFPLYGQPRPVASHLLALAAAEQHISLSKPPLESLSCQIDITGELGTEYARWLGRRAQSHQLRGGFSATTQERVSLVAAGPATAVAALVSMAIIGPKDARPRAVHTTHVPPPDTDTFTTI